MDDFASAGDLEIGTTTQRASIAAALGSLKQKVLRRRIALNAGRKSNSVCWDGDVSINAFLI